MITIFTIIEASSTYSEEGAPVLKPLLTDADPDLRQSAIEGMKQLGVPGAAAALREAAKRTSLSPEDRQAMLEAANFVELEEWVPPVGARGLILERA